jgi:hypothetical protein
VDLTLLDTLRFKIATDKVLADTFEYFFDNFGEVPEFFKCGAPVIDNFLVQLLAQIGGEIFKTGKVTVRDSRLFRIQEYSFIHGGLTMNGAIGNVIYFDDIQQGILAVHRPSARGSTDFVRFSAHVAPTNGTTEASKFRQ